MRYNITNKCLYKRLLKILEPQKALSFKTLPVEVVEVVDTLYKVLSKGEPDYNHLLKDIKKQINSEDVTLLKNRTESGQLNPIESKVWVHKMFFKGAGVVAVAVVLLLLFFHFHHDISGWFNGYGNDVNPEIVAKLNQVHDRHRARLIIDDAFEIDLYGDTASFIIDGLGVGVGSIKNEIGNSADGRATDGRSDLRLSDRYGVSDDRMPDKHKDDKQVQMHTLIIPKGGEFFITLSDGTQVFLNSNSKLTFPSRFTGETREVQLEGEALFTVVNDDTPFNVISRNSITTVMGTVFNVRSCPGNDLVTLCSGSVSVSNSSGSISRVITPAHQASVGVLGIQVVKTDVMEVVAWTEGKFYFKNISLEEIAAKLYDWYDIEFGFDDQALRQVPFTGMINRNSSLSTIFELFEMSYDIKFKITDKKVIIRSSFTK